MKIDEPNRLKNLPEFNRDDPPFQIINKLYPDSPSLKQHILFFVVKSITIIITISTILAIIFRYILQNNLLFILPTQFIGPLEFINNTLQTTIDTFQGIWAGLVELWKLLISTGSSIFVHVSNPINILFAFFLIFVILQLIKFRIPLTRSISFFPFTFSWSSTVTIELQNAHQIGYRLHTYLTNNPKFKLTYWIYLGKPSNYVKISCTRKRFLLPFSTTSILAMLHGLFLSYAIEIKPTAAPKVRFSYRVYHIKSSDSVPLLTPLITSLRNQGFSGLIVGKYQAKRRKFDNIPDDGLKYSTKLLIQHSNPIDLNLVQATVESQLHNSRLSRFSWFSNKYVPQIQARLILELPLIEELIKPIQQWDFENLPTHYQPEVIIGKVMRNEQVVGDFGIKASDLRKGGIIAGAIGSGKTNMRLHLVNHLINSGVKIIDFDIKGDVPRYKELGEKGLTLIPKRNFWMNPFEKPEQYSSREFSDMLLNSFVATLPDAEMLTPPQMNLLTKSITLTVKTEGNARSFLRNIILIAKKDQKLISNFQEATAHALMSKFNWLQGSLKDVFWVSQSSHTAKEMRNNSLFFDLSELKATSSVSVIRFFIELFMMKVVSWYNDADPLSSDLPRLIVSIDEAQLLLPRRKSSNLTPIEEVVTTLRYKGLSVLAAGVNADKMSDVLLDTGFIAQYRSDSEELLRALGLRGDQRFMVPRLKPYQAIVKADSAESKPLMALIHQIEFQHLNNDEYHALVKIIGESTDKEKLKLEQFVISEHELFRIKVMLELPKLLSMNDLKVEQANVYLRRQYQAKNVEIVESVEKKDYAKIKIILEGILGVDSSSEEYSLIAIYSFIEYLYMVSQENQKFKWVTRNYKDLIAKIKSSSN